MKKVLFSSRVSFPAISRMIAGATDYALERGGVLLLEEKLDELRHVHKEAFRFYDGVLTWAGGYDEWAPELWEEGFPIVNCNPVFEGRMPSVSAGDSFHSAAELVRKLGRKQFAFITADSEPTWRDRYAAVMEETNDLGLEGHYFDRLRQDPSVVPGHIFDRGGEPELIAFLRDLPKPALVCCVHDPLAALVCQTALDHGLKVPEDVAIFGLGDSNLARLYQPTLSSIPLPDYQQGYEAMRLLEQLMNGRSFPMAEMTVNLRNRPVAERESTGGICPFLGGLEKARRLIKEQACEGITVEALIDEAKMGRVTFYQLFQKTYGISPGEALRRARLERACDHLMYSNLPMAQVSELCGFSNPSQFNNFFRRETGFSPGAWRDRSRQAPSDTPVLSVHGSLER